MKQNAEDRHQEVLKMIESFSDTASSVRNPVLEEIDHSEYHR
jgi:hypothetical protein